MAWSDRVAALALSVIRDPAASLEEKAEARRAVLGGRLDTSHLTRDERAVLRHLVSRCLDPAAPPSPLAKLLERRAGELAAERVRAMTVGDHLAAIVALDPGGDQVRRFADQDSEAQNAE